MKPFFTVLLFAFFSLNSYAQTACSDGEYLSTEYVTGEYMTGEGDCDKIEKQPLSIFPNPTTDFFEVKNAVDTEGVLFNSVGQFVRRVKLQGMIDVSDLPKAMYILRVDSETIKLVIQ